MTGNDVTLRFINRGRDICVNSKFVILIDSCNWRKSVVLVIAQCVKGSGRIKMKLKEKG